MKYSSLFRRLIVVAFALVATTAYAQDNKEKIKAKWAVVKFEIAEDKHPAPLTLQDLQEAILTFGDAEVMISKKTSDGETVIKKGTYSVAENSITLGKDKAEIIALSEKRLTIRIPNQGILYLIKM